VNSDYSIQKLLEKELIIILGRNEDLPGKPLVYSTSKSFMDYFGINSAEDLPKIKEVLSEQSIQGTLINEAAKTHAETESEVSETNDNDMPETEPAPPEGSGTTLIVADNGELIEQQVNDINEKSPAAEVSDKTTLADEEINPGDKNNGNDNPSLSSSDIKGEE